MYLLGKFDDPKTFEFNMAAVQDIARGTVSESLTWKLVGIERCIKHVNWLILAWGIHFWKQFDDLMIFNDTIIQFKSQDGCHLNIYTEMLKEQCYYRSIISILWNIA